MHACTNSHMHADISMGSISIFMTITDLKSQSTRGGRERPALLMLYVVWAIYGSYFSPSGRIMRGVQVGFSAVGSAKDKRHF